VVLGTQAVARPPSALESCLHVANVVFLSYGATKDDHAEVVREKTEAHHVNIKDSHSVKGAVDLLLRIGSTDWNRWLLN
jgi:hypothetical protein